MSVASELHTAALAIDSDDPLMHAVAGLLDQIASTTPPSVIESQVGAATRKALLVARAYRSPGKSLADACICRGPVGSVQCVVHGVRPVLACGQGGGAR